MHFRSPLWVGPALLFSSATAISILGWAGKVRTILSIRMPHAVLVGAPNDGLWLAHLTEISPRQKKGKRLRAVMLGYLNLLLLDFLQRKKGLSRSLTFLKSYIKLHQGLIACASLHDL